MVAAVDYLQAMRVRKIGRIALDQVLKPFDALIAPSSTSFPGLVTESFRRRATQTPSGKQPHGETEAALVPAGNIAGLPGLTIPNGFGKEHLPSGIQLLGSAWSEATLLQIANAYQSVTEWHTKRPHLEDV
jgi:aspartyl-tRNA(Asn)/glutamyl-tRNA(Gln) amidotransferase subunit A